ncbi:hypothetical protein NDR87_01875 [Nocardia sp. CDC159]|uniref:DUF3558 domain-containing protein n=1 Tax=Nocardia pulmonis TaxID=2951408 RepID=A0A9X2E128_9NOCA|nr:MULTISPECIES: hypothetical protein [Nocardia]MCM6772242.1 hypothetical protein [Nocardia pulmonis]MCM6785100.1 hypothetical protein [Nocardia sp. CDC159]
MRKSLVLLAVVSVGGALLSMAAPARPAAGGDVDLECFGRFEVEFSPALGSTARPTRVTETDTYEGCRVGALVGRSTRSYTINISCSDWATTKPPGNEIVHWVGGFGDTYSSVHYSRVVAGRNEVTYVGEVIGGRLHDHNAEKVLIAESIAAPTCAPDSAVRGASGGIRLTLTNPEW